ncbi:MAG: N-acetyltransferase [Acidimicrobiales bacterium]
MGANSSCAIKTDDSLWCWGSNRWHQLGDGTADNVLNPIPVGADRSWRTVSTGITRMCGIDTTGTLWCWGLLYGMPPGPRRQPVLRTAPDRRHAWLAVSSQGIHTCAIRADRTLWCFDNTAGRWGSAPPATSGGKCRSPRSAPTPTGGHPAPTSRDLRYRDRQLAVVLGRPRPLTERPRLARRPAVADRLGADPSGEPCRSSRRPDGDRPRQATRSRPCAVPDSKRWTTPLPTFDSPERQRYELIVDDRIVSIADYSRDGDRIVVPHVETDPALRGQGMADRLMQGMLDDLRARDLTITPICSFAAAFIRAHPADADLRLTRARRCRHAWRMVAPSDITTSASRPRPPRRPVTGIRSSTDAETMATATPTDGAVGSAVAAARARAATPVMALAAGPAALTRRTSRTLTCSSADDHATPEYHPTAPGRHDASRSTTAT